MSVHGRTTLAPESTRTSAPPAKVRQYRSKQGVFCVWQGLNRKRWNEVSSELPGDPRGYFLRRASVAGLSFLNSWHEWWESVLFGRQVAATELTEPPIFILGHWRSGTTLLHNLLTLDPQLATPNLYQVMFSGHFLLTERIATALTGWMMPATRPMDNVPAGWQYSQEDEVAILLRTGLSPYRMVQHQGNPAQYERFLELVDITPEERQRWIADFRLFLKKLTYKTGKPIVLKSPTHTYRIPLLLELFPNARFLSIMRDPYTVYSSTVHLRKTMFIENGLSQPNFTGLEAEILDTYDKCLQRYEATKSLIPAGQLHELRFRRSRSRPADRDGAGLPTAVTSRLGCDGAKVESVLTSSSSLQEELVPTRSGNPSPDCRSLPLGLRTLRLPHHHPGNRGSRRVTPPAVLRDSSASNRRGQPAARRYGSKTHSVAESPLGLDRLWNWSRIVADPRRTTALDFVPATQSSRMARTDGDRR